MSFGINSLYDEIMSLTIQCRERNMEQYRKIETFNGIAKFLIENTLKSENENVALTGNQILIISLFIKILNRAESIVFTTERGIEADAKMLLRGLIEQLIMLKLCCDDNENHKIYAKKSILMKRGTINDLLDKKVIKGEKNIRNLKEVKEKVERITKTFDISKKENIDIEKLARRAGLYNIYAKYYRMFSDEAHSAYNTLEGYLLIDRDKNLITEIRNRSIDNSRGLLNILIAFLAKAVCYYSTYMCLNNIEVPKELEDEFKAVWSS